MSEKPLKAFVAADARVDTAFVREVLSLHGVTCDDAFSSKADVDVVKAVLKGIRSADIVIAILADGGWAAYEIGIADALRKPVLIIAAPGVLLPDAIASRQVLRAVPSDSEVVRLTIRKLVDDARSKSLSVWRRPSSGQRRLVSSTRVQELAWKIRDARPIAEGQRVEELVWQLLKAVGVTAVARESPDRDRGVDFAVWADVT